MAQQTHLCAVHKLRISRQCPERLIDDGVSGAEAAEMDIVKCIWVKAILYHCRLYIDGFIQ